MIRDSFECQPGDLLKSVGLEEAADLPAAHDIEQTLVKLKAERERLGGVNLRAEEEAAQLGGEFDGMEKERSDLQEAIGKLRTGIAELEQGRPQAPARCVRHGADAFRAAVQGAVRGRRGASSAHRKRRSPGKRPRNLRRPPGKKPQVLTLLSGGEKALTALALIFAVFLTNPSPICVLDEVDAPLDDANVDRFCSMMEEMSRSTRRASSSSPTIR